MNIRRLTLRALAIGALTGTFVSGAAAQSVGLGVQRPNVDPRVYQQLSVKDDATFWVFLRTRASLAGAAAHRSKPARGRHVISQLQNTALQSQANVIGILRSRRAPHKPFWISNAIKVSGNRATLDAIAVRPEVDRIVPDVQYYVPPPIPGTAAGVTAFDWNISRIRANEVWDFLGDTGQGIVVANIDTGVDYTHEALTMQYRGNFGGMFDHNYNFYDPNGACGPPGSPPCDTDGHGTHTMGTMVGGDGSGPLPNDIGVAPGARWISAVGCIGRGCPIDALLASGQWMLAPTDQFGNNPDPSRAPHIINNSWGGGPGDAFYQDIVRAWVAAGIFPAFSNGNDGPSCGTAGSPGDYWEAFASGATDINDQIAFFSSRGPSVFGPLKPDVSAPGQDVFSSVPGGYAFLSGTSMASPHVAGTVALMWAGAPGLIGDVPTTMTILRQTAVNFADFSCGGDAFANNVYGEGRIDAFEAVASSPRIVGTLQGSVTELGSGIGVGGARIDSFRADDGLLRSTTADAGGFYSYALPVDPGPSDLYIVSASAFGYLTQTSTIDIIQDTTATLSFTLTPLPRHTISGYVRDSAGAPVAGATVSVLMAPIPPVTTDPTGFYAISGIPDGFYTLTAGGGRCMSSATTSVFVGGDTPLDFVLDPRVDAFGYRCQIAAPQWVDATNPLPLFGDDSSISVPLPFPFVLYGQTYFTAYVATNGHINFLRDFPTFSNVALPDPFEPNAAIYPFWDDLLVNPGGVLSETLGSAPNRVFVIEWLDAGFFGGGGEPPVSFEIKLHELDGTIEFLYRNANGRGSGTSATIGIENFDGTIGFQYGFDDGAASDAEAIQFLAPPIGFVAGRITDAIDSRPLPGVLITALENGARVMTDQNGDYLLALIEGTYTLQATIQNYQPASATVPIVRNITATQNFALDSARAVATPTSFDLILLSGERKLKEIGLSNTGRAPLTFSTQERVVAPGGLRVQRAGNSSTRPGNYQQRSVVTTLAGGPVLVFGDVLPWGLDSLYQVLTLNGIPFDSAGSSQMATIDMSAYEAVFVSSDQTAAFYAAYRANVTRFNDYLLGGGVLWFGASAWGFNGGDLTGATLPGGATINGPVYEGLNSVVDPGHPLMQGVPDPFSGNAASHATFGSLPPGARVIAATTRGEPTLIEYDVGAGRVIAFGQTLEFSFRNGDVGRILENGVPYAYAIEPVVDLPWLTLTPSSGTVQQGASLRIALTIDTAGLTPGLYRARIALVTNDPTNTTILIPVTLVVTDYRVGVNSGGPAYTDRAGDVWAADQLATTTRFGYTNNRSSTARTTNAIASTEDDPLYQRQRVDAGGYRFPGVPSGTYEVELLFAEFDVRRPNQRLFDVYVENTLVLPAFDVYNDVGRFVADHKKFMVTVTDGIANLQLVPRRGYRVPIINGIRVTHRVDRD